MWTRFFSTCFIFLLLVGAATAQEAIRTSELSSVITAIPATPRVISNDPARYWVAAWRQDNSIVSRIIQKDGTLGPIKTLVTGISSSQNNFDLIFLRRTGNYLLAYEATDGLRVQSFSKHFAKQGISIVILKGKNMQPRLLMDEPGTRVFLFWLTGTGGRFFKRIELSESGHPVGPIINAIIAGQGNSFQAFAVANNPTNQIQFAVITQTHPTNGTKLLGIPFRIDGSMVRTEPFVFQNYPSASDVSGTAAFSSDGKGAVVWPAGNQIRYRFLTPEGIPTGTMTFIENVADATSNPSTVYDSKKEMFIQGWTKGSEIYASVNDPRLQAAKLEYDAIASASGKTLNAHTAYDRATGRLIVVWEEQNGNTYKVQATVFSVYIEEFEIEGVVTLRKDYHPPYVINGKKYLRKYHVKSGGKLYKAYITPETEVIGSLPKAGDRIHMEYYPLRKRYRGYAESIRVLPPSTQSSQR
jgi:hypothetical protein